jgi:ATP-dependent DNA helicase RecG
MPRIDQQENQTLEFKRQWTDKALEDLAAFANTEGGTLLVGIRDDGEIVGTTADDREIQRLAKNVSKRRGKERAMSLRGQKGAKGVRMGSQRGQRGRVMGTENKMSKAQADVCTG